MTSISVQFFAPESELLEMLAGWLHGIDTYVVAEQFHPKWRVAPIPDGDVKSAPLVVDELDGVTVSTSPIDCRSGRQVEYSRANAGSLFVGVGRIGEFGLRESRMGAISDSPDVIAVWRKVIGRARRQLHRGGWAQDPHSGNWIEIPGIRYSDGALKMFGEGIPMVQTTKPFHLGPRPDTGS